MDSRAKTVISVNNVTKYYDGSTIPALNDVSFEVKSGEVYGFLGPNGAGKSTAIRILMSFIRATSGDVSIFGKDIGMHDTSVRSKIGYLTGDSSLYPKMTGRQILSYLAELQGMASLTPALELADRIQADLDKKAGELSRGNKQKLAIIQAFMHSPDVYIFDEPTSGLDPLAQEVFYDLVSEAKKRGAAVFMSSHNLSEVQKICDRVGIIKSGKVINESSIAEMALKAAQTFEISFKKQPPLDHLKKIPDSHIESVDKKTVVIHVTGDLRPLFKVLSSHETTKLEAHSLDLEEQFIKFYSKEPTQ